MLYRNLPAMRPMPPQRIAGVELQSLTRNKDVCLNRYILSSLLTISTLSARDSNRNFTAIRKMSELTDDKATKVSTDGTQTHMRQVRPARLQDVAATDHVEHYYRALESARAEIASFFMPATTILYCGNVIPSAQDLQGLFDKEMPPLHFDVQSFDCQVLNPSAPSGTNSAASGRNMSVLVLVSGSVKVGPPREAELRGFSETFILVPNPGATGPKRRGKPTHEWLIQSSNFRFTV